MLPMRALQGWVTLFPSGRRGAASKDAGAVRRRIPRRHRHREFRTMSIDPTQRYLQSRALRGGDRELLRREAAARIDLLARLPIPSLFPDMASFLAFRGEFHHAAYQAAL